MRVVGTSSGYISGLGSGPKPPKGMKEGRTTEENAHFTQQMTQQFEQLEKMSRAKEAQLEEKIKGLQQDKVFMLEEMHKMKGDVIEREERMRSEMRALMRGQLSSFKSTQLNRKR